MRRFRSWIQLDPKLIALTPCLKILTEMHFVDIVPKKERKKERKKIYEINWAG